MGDRAVGGTVELVRGDAAEEGEGVGEGGAVLGQRAGLVGSDTAGAVIEEPGEIRAVERVEDIGAQLQPGRAQGPPSAGGRV